MASLVDGIKDLLKYKVVSNVDTGDKSQDNLINAIILAFIAAIFTPGLKYRIQFLIGKMLSKCVKQKITKSNYEDMRNYIAMNHASFSQVTWTIKNNIYKDSLTCGMTQYIIKNYSWIFKKGSLFVIDEKGHKTIYNDSCDHEWYTLAKLFEEDVIYPIYISGKSVVAIIKNKGDVGIYLMHNNDEILEEFTTVVLEQYKPTKIELEHINEHIIEKPEEIKVKQCVVHDYYADVNVDIYKDRKFDKIVSRHKQKIINLLDNLVESNNPGSQSNFGGLGTYNLGIMFYGPPGTGKTSFIKAICNYLQRDAVIIDMRRIKTISDLKKAFNKFIIKGCVYVFDEFDCIQHMLTRDVKNVKEEKKDLQTEMAQLLKIKASAVAGSNTTHIDTQIDSIRNKLDTLDNQLNLENMLTFLDGTEEKRNRVIIAATNHIEKIDPALIRAGRFDAKICLDRFNDAEIKEQLSIMFPNDKEKIIAQSFPENVFVPVEITNIVQETRSIDETIKILLAGKPTAEKNKSTKSEDDNDNSKSISRSPSTSSKSSVEGEKNKRSKAPNRSRQRNK